MTIRITIKNIKVIGKYVDWNQYFEIAVSHDLFSRNFNIKKYIDKRNSEK